MSVRKPQRFSLAAFRVVFREVKKAQCLRNPQVLERNVCEPRLRQ